MIELFYSPLNFIFKNLKTEYTGFVLIIFVFLLSGFVLLKNKKNLFEGKIKYLIGRGFIVFGIELIFVPLAVYFIAYEEPIFILLFLWSFLVTIVGFLFLIIGLFLNKKKRDG